MSYLSIIKYGEYIMMSYINISITYIISS